MGISLFIIMLYHVIVDIFFAFSIPRRKKNTRRPGRHPLYPRFALKRVGVSAEISARNMNEAPFPRSGNKGGGTKCRGIASPTSR